MHIIIKGCLKNDNNFATLNDCKSFCHEFLNEEAKKPSAITGDYFLFYFPIQ